MTCLSGKLEATIHRSRKDGDKRIQESYANHRERSRSLEAQKRRMEGQVSNLKKAFVRSGISPVARVNRYTDSEFDAQRQTRPCYSPVIPVQHESRRQYGNPTPPEKDLVHSEYYKELDENADDSNYTKRESESTKKVYSSPRGDPNPYQSVQKTKKTTFESVSPRTDAVAEKVRYSPRKYIRFAGPLDAAYEGNISETQKLRSSSPGVWDISRPDSPKMWINKRYDYGYDDSLSSKARYVHHIPGYGYGYYDYPSPRAGYNRNSPYSSKGNSSFFDSLDTSIYSPRPSKWDRRGYGGPIYRRSLSRSPVYTDPWEELDNYAYYQELQGKPEEEIKSKLKREISDPVYVDPPESKNDPFYKRLWDERNKHTSARRVPPEESLLPPQKEPTRGNLQSRNRTPPGVKSWQRDVKSRSPRFGSPRTRSPSPYGNRRSVSPYNRRLSPGRRQYNVTIISPEDQEVQRYLSESREESEVRTDYGYPCSPRLRRVRPSSAPPEPIYQDRGGSRSYLDNFNRERKSPRASSGADMVDSRYRREMMERNDELSYSKSERESSHQVYSSPRYYYSRPRWRSVSPVRSQPRYDSPSWRRTSPYITPSTDFGTPRRRLFTTSPTANRNYLSSPRLPDYMENQASRDNSYLPSSRSPCRTRFSDLSWMSPPDMCQRSGDIYRSSILKKDKQVEMESRNKNVYSEYHKNKEEQYIGPPEKTVICGRCLNKKATKENSSTSSSSESDEPDEARCSRCKKSLNDSGYSSIRMERNDSSGSEGEEPVSPISTKADKLVSKYQKSKQKWEKFGNKQNLYVMPVDEIQKTKYKEKKTTKKKNGSKSQKETTEYKSVHITSPRGTIGRPGDAARLVPPLDLSSCDDDNVSLEATSPDKRQYSYRSVVSDYSGTSPSRAYKYLMGSDIELAPWQKEYLRIGTKFPKDRWDSDRGFSRESRETKESSYTVTDGDYRLESSKERTKRSKESSSSVPTDSMQSALSMTSAEDVYSTNFPVLGREQLAALAVQAKPQEKFAVRKIPQKKETPYMVISMGKKNPDSCLIVPKKSCKNLCMQKRDFQDMVQGTFPKKLQKYLSSSEEEHWSFEHSTRHSRQEERSFDCKCRERKIKPCSNYSQKSSRQACCQSHSNYYPCCRERELGSNWEASLDSTKTDISSKRSSKERVRSKQSNNTPQASLERIEEKETTRSSRHCCGRNKSPCSSQEQIRNKKTTKSITVNRTPKSRP